MADLILKNPAVATYIHLFKPGDDGKYTVTLLFDKQDPAQMESVQQIAAAITDLITRGTTEEIGWNSEAKAKVIPFPGGNANDPNFIKTLALPLKDADTYVLRQGQNAGKTRAEVKPEFAGKYYMQLSTTKDLTHQTDAEGHPISYLVDASQGVAGPALTTATLYPGAMVKPNIWLSPYPAGKNHGAGISANLQALIKTGDGTPLIDLDARNPLTGFNLPTANGAKPGTSDTPSANPLAAMGI